MTTDPETDAVPKFADMLRELASAAATAIRRDEAVAALLRKLLVTTGRVRSTVDIIRTLPATLDRVAALIRDVAEAVLPEVIHDPAERLSGIRRFFLEPEESYSIHELATLWQITRDDARDVLHDQVLAWSGSHPQDGPDALRIRWADAVGISVSCALLRPYDIEVALAEDFDLTRSDRWRTVPILIRAPRFVVEAISSDSSLAGRRHLACLIEEFLLQLFQGEYRNEFTDAVKRE